MKFLQGLLLILSCLFMASMVVLVTTGYPLIDHIQKLILNT